MAIREERGSNPSQAWPVLTAKPSSKGFSNESKRTSITISEVLSAQTASSGESPGRCFCGEREATGTQAFSWSIPVPTNLTRFPAPPRGYMVATYQPPPPSRIPESRPLPTPPQHSGQSSPVAEKGHNSRLSDTNPTSYPPLPPKYSPPEAGQGFDDNVSELLRQQPRAASLPAYDSGYKYFQGPHEEDETRLGPSQTYCTIHSPIVSIPVGDAFRANAPAERSPRHSSTTHFASPTLLEDDPSEPINTPDHSFPLLAHTTLLGRSGDMDNEQVKGPPTMPEVYPPGQSVPPPKPKDGGNDAPKLHVANPTPSTIASGSTNVSPLSDLSMPMSPAQATERTSPTSSGHLHSDDVQPSSSSLPSTALPNSQPQSQDTSPATSPTTGKPKPFIYPSGRSQAGAKSKPTPSVSSDNTERSRFNRVLRLWKNWNKKDSMKLDKGKQRQQEDDSDTQPTPVRPGSRPLPNPSSGSLIEMTDLRAETLDKEQVADIQGASNSNSGEMSVGVGEEHVEGPSKSRIGSYPLDPFDAVLLDHDRRTGELLRRLNPTDSPTFYDYGTLPPREVLDLGCGQGHWVVQAAKKWSGYGTKVTGYDKVDRLKALLPLADEHGVAGHVKFVRGDFLMPKLPFEDGTFDLVRMSCLTLCVTAGAWPLVFQEVCRVLAPGGRLEVIEDSIIFPPLPLVVAPLNLESLFEEMLLWTFGISLHPDTFISPLMKEIFGYGELVKVMHLTLAHSSPKVDEAADAGESSSSVGLLHLPSTFFPMEQEEVDMHASKHTRSLLSCKHLLVEYVIGTATNEEVSDEVVLEALSEYESSIHQRLGPSPPDTNGRVSDSQVSNDSTRIIRTFRVFEAIKMERIPYTSTT